MIERIRFREIWSVDRPIIGMVHLLPLPGSPAWGGSIDAVVERALADARALESGGVDACLVENYMDVPFHRSRVPPATVAAMTRVAREVVVAVGLPVGVNVLRNDAAAALSVAVASGARFIRVNVHAGAMLTDQGWIRGRAAHTLRLRAALDAPVAIFADVLVKHAVRPAGLDERRAAQDVWHRALADALIISGEATGERTDAERMISIRDAVPEAPIVIGSGLAPNNAADLLPLADAAIVGSALQHDGVAGRGIDPTRVDRLMDAVRAVRSHT
jgi:membrane complex biogenesis BtpA family protein